MLAQRLRSSGRAIFRTVSPRAWGGGGGSIFQSVALPNLKRKASNTWSAVQETYLSTKQVFESHRVVFTIGTSVASILTAWAGYSLRQYHQSKIEKRLGSIEQALVTSFYIMNTASEMMYDDLAGLKNNYEVERQEFKKIVGSGNVSTAVCVATAWTSLVVGYGLGWRGGAWYTNRKFQREQLKLMGQIKPQKWQFLRRPLRFRNTRPVHGIQVSLPVVDAGSPAPQHLQKSQ